MQVDNLRFAWNPNLTSGPNDRSLSRPLPHPGVSFLLQFASTSANVLSIIFCHSEIVPVRRLPRSSCSFARPGTTALISYNRLTFRLPPLPCFCAVPVAVIVCLVRAERRVVATTKVYRRSLKGSVSCGHGGEEHDAKVEFEHLDEGSIEIWAEEINLTWSSMEEMGLRE